MHDRDQLAASLRRWAEDHGPHVRAAVNLLLGQEWLDDDRFTGSCIRADTYGAWIDWDAARAYVDAGPPSSAGQLGMLRLVVDLGSDRYEFNQIDGLNIRAAISAFTEAAGR